MQGEDAFDWGGSSQGVNEGPPGRRCTSIADGCATVLIGSPSPSPSPRKSFTTCSRGSSEVGARSGDGKTRRYVRSSEPRLKWSEELHERFMIATEKLGGADSECQPCLVIHALT